jgi:hypothetical protein
MASNNNDVSSSGTASENSEISDHRITDRDHIQFPAPTTSNILNAPRVDDTTIDISRNSHESRGHIDECGKTRDEIEIGNKEDVEAINYDSGSQESGEIRKNVAKATGDVRPQGSSAGTRRDEQPETQERRERSPKAGSKKQEEVCTGVF